MLEVLKLDVMALNKPKLSKRKLRELMQSYDRGMDYIEDINEDTVIGFQIAINIVKDIIDESRYDGHRFKIRVENLLWHVGGNTKVIIGECSNPDNKFVEIWRGKVDDLDWKNVPCGNRFIEHVTVVEGEDWLQIWV